MPIFSHVGALLIKTFPQNTTTLTSSNSTSPISINNQINRLKSDPRVTFIEQDKTVEAFSQIIPTGEHRIDLDKSILKVGQGTATVSSDIAIIDSGINSTHPDLNVVDRVTFVPGDTIGNDNCGHGTHVAGIAAAKDNNIGVVGNAPGARLWSIKVLEGNSSSSCSGSESSIIDGIDYVTAHANQIKVVNMSLGRKCNAPAEEVAIQRSVAAGVTYVVAAGNNSEDASTFSPASFPEVIAVSAIADSDGKCGGLGSYYFG